MEKKKTLQEEGVDTVAKPQRKAILPAKEVIWTLEEVAAESGQTPAGSGENMSANTILDQYIRGVVRFQTLQEEGVDTVAKPQQKAILPTKEVIWTLEEVATQRACVRSTRPPCVCAFGFVVDLGWGSGL